VREGRSFSPDEFAIALEQVVSGSAPVDYRNPKKFFDRTYFTRALREHTGMVLRLREEYEKADGRAGSREPRKSTNFSLPIQTTGTGVKYRVESSHLRRA
jgi:predicted AAA+ superfamily ATPase